jgi:hypothetical protein
MKEMCHPLSGFLIRAHGGITRQVVGVGDDIPNIFCVIALYQEMFCGLRITIT